MMQIKIHKEGLVYFITSLLVSFFMLFFSYFVAFFLFILSIYIYYFFRDPVRSIPVEDLVLSPADGIVTCIEKTEPPITVEGVDQFIKISIFLNIFNVHVNRIPVKGMIKKIKYIHGKFINATLNKSSIDNERNIILIEKNNKDILIITQIAGLIARRIVSDVKENQEVFQGHRFGIIKFGSRVDLYMPIHYKPLVAKGQIVIAGETIFANPNEIVEINNSILN